MLQHLPLEIVYQILVYVPVSTFIHLYQTLPQHIVDAALQLKLKIEKDIVLQLVSTNIHEVVAPRYQRKQLPSSSVHSHHQYYRYHYQSQRQGSNESSIPLFYKHMDMENRIIWLAPDFDSTQYYFEVKDFYVSHGKLILRRWKGNSYSKVLGSLWDIRNKFPPSRSGNFSGATSHDSRISSSLSSSSSSSSVSLSHYHHQHHPDHYQQQQQQQAQQFIGNAIYMTMSTEASTDNKGGKSTMNDSTLLDKDNNHAICVLDAYCVLSLDEQGKGPNIPNKDSMSCINTNSLFTAKRYGYPPRPLSAHTNGSKELLVGVSEDVLSPWYTAVTCGYFVIENVGVSVDQLLSFL